MENVTSSLLPQSFVTSLDEVLGVAISLLIIVILWYYFTKVSKQCRTVKDLLPPGPKPWPIVGCIPEIIKYKPTFRWIHDLMKEMNTEIACIRLGSVHVIPVMSPSLSREFLKTQDAVFASRPLSMATRLASKGYLTTALVPMGTQWKKMKKIVVSLVASPAKHRWLHGKRLEEADHLVRYVYNQCKGGVEKVGIVNIRIATQHYCGNVIRKMVFNKRFFGKGMEDGGPGVEENEHIDGLFCILAHLFSFCLSDYLPFLEGFDLDGHEKVMKKVIGNINKPHDLIIKERVQQWKDDKQKEVEDLLDVLINLKDSSGNALLSIDEIRAQILEIMIAVVDNPSNAAEWALAEMLNQPHIFQKAVEELDRVVGRERLVQESDFSQLNYVKACAREAFRLHPIAPFNVPHLSLSDTKVGNYFIPKGSHVLLSRMGLGRNPKVWDDPLEFRPERHLNESGSDVVLTESDLRFISFSTGMRGCVGVTLGSSMTTMLFARLLHAFTWELPPRVSNIDLSEELNSLALVKPLLALAKPRLPTHVYPLSENISTI